MKRRPGLPHFCRGERVAHAGPMQQLGVGAEGAAPRQRGIEALHRRVGASRSSTAWMPLREVNARCVYCSRRASCASSSCRLSLTRFHAI